MEQRYVPGRLDERDGLKTQPMTQKRATDSWRLWPRVAHAGFPSPGEEYAEPPLNIHDLLVRNPLATYFIRVRGQSMRGAGIGPGDIIVVDRSLTARHHQVVLVRIGDHLLLKRLLIREREVYLQTDPPRPQPLLLDLNRDMEIWGVVTYCISRVR
jgi:DNA polymerase V